MSQTRYPNTSRRCGDPEHLRPRPRPTSPPVPSPVMARFAALKYENRGHAMTGPLSRKRSRGIGRRLRHIFPLRFYHWARRGGVLLGCIRRPPPKPPDQRREASLGHRANTSCRLRTPATRAAAVWWLLLVAAVSTPHCSATPGAAGECQVLAVNDGDTVTLSCAEAGLRRVRVRLWGIDAPEIGQRPWGELAKQRLKELASDRVALEFVDKDDYGRLVGRLHRGGEDLGLTLVREGYARVYRRFNGWPVYRQAEHEAREQRRGLWSRPGNQQTPWRWRRTHPRQ